jgi:uncharacterized protein (DUF2062 family)
MDQLDAPVGRRRRLAATAGLVWRRLRGGELTAARAAWSIAVGVGVGVTPLWGLHLPIVLALCLPLRLDFALAYLAANVSVPPIAPFISLAELQIGSLVLTGRGLAAPGAGMAASALGALAREGLVGTAILSPSAAAASGLLTWFVARAASRATRGGSDDFAKAAARVAARYREAGDRGAYHYVKAKLALDPVARRMFDVARESPLGDTVDLGCGRGQLGVLLVQEHLAGRVTGIDADERKIAVATRAARGLDASFRVADVRGSVPERCDTALLIDVLHYLRDEDQIALLRDAARASSRLVLVRDIDPDAGLRSGVTRLQELLARLCGVNRASRTNARPIARVKQELEAEGFVVDQADCSQGTPFSNVLLVARRRQTDSALEAV